MAVTVWPSGSALERESWYFASNLALMYFVEDEPEDYALVFCCVEVASQHVGSFPDLVFEAYGDGVGGVFLGHNVCVACV